MAPRPGTRRRRLLAMALLPGVLAVAVTIAVLAWAEADGDERYTPGEPVAGITRKLERAVPASFAPVQFVDVAAAAGIAFRHFHGSRSTQLPEDMGSGLAWGDYDGDGDPDLYLVNEAGALTERSAWPASPAADRLYRNDGDGTFTDVTAATGLGSKALGMAAAWGDADGDGDLDLLVTTYGALHLFENAGGRFAEVTAAAGLDQRGYWSGASWGDCDRDGDLDLYVCGYVIYTFDPRDRDARSSQYASVVPASLNPSTYTPHRNVLFENDGEGRFTDVTARAGVANLEGRSLGAAWCDFDDDGWPDLYVANDVSDNVLYRNLGDGTFADVSHAALVADYRGAMGIAVGDCDADGDQDLFVTHWIAQENALYLNRLRQQGRLTFGDEADRLGLGQIALDFVGWGTFFFDFDNDTRSDLFVANGSTLQDADDERLLVPMQPLLFWNDGPERGFFEVGDACGACFSRATVARGAAPADYDGDGDLDIAVLHHGEDLALLQNRSDNDHHWLGVRLRGHASNTFGVGAKVTVVTGGRAQTAVVGATPSYLSQPDLTLHFGLGMNARVDRIEVRWPSGTAQALADVAADRVLTVEEPQ